MILFVILAVFFWRSVMDIGPTPIELSYSDFLNYVRQGRVSEVTIGEAIKGRFLDGEEFITYRVDDPNLVEELRKANVKFTGIPPAQPSWWLGLISPLITVVLIGLLWYFMFRQAQGANNQAMSFGRSRARLASESKVKVTFADVAGVEEAKEELREVVEFLKNPKKFQAVGAKIPKGVLLVGPPGSGKTLLARAVAGEAGVPFFSISGSEFVEMFVGVGASRVRDLFNQAKKSAPCIIFIDEIDAVGRQRGAGLGGGHDEREQTLNQLLVEMDGFDPNMGIIVIAATNRPDILDPALLRPGRIDRKVVVDNPDLEGRLEILKIHARGKPLAEDVNLQVIAQRTPGFSGADLANLLNESALLAARRGKNKITMEELEEAIDKVIAGPERKSRVLSEKEKELIAYHEVGHALVTKFLPNADKVHRISIIPRGMALGYTLHLPTEDKHILTKAELLDKIVTALGGRAAEEIIFNETTTGAQNDLEVATEIARRMVTEFGMSEELGPLTFGKKQGQVFLGRDLIESRNYSEQVAFMIDREIRRIIESCYDKAKDILVKNKETLIKIASILKEKETIEAEEFDKLIAQPA
ncbi:MAG: ATP-dependent zinc metalloprotease FtsH [Dictyoglomi bacterium]|nr:ATP-dependent zinc metalloprotease FtsH [Dictyoglomota bacterium]HOK30000.1 ATP-dependent zinc metalloprotease FtsH [bacterium]HPO82482.1 ATP-dependent zinc metalloprotease FtsH [bacterium]